MKRIDQSSDCLPSTDIPSSIHRRNRQALQRFRFVTLIRHVLSK